MRSAIAALVLSALGGCGTDQVTVRFLTDRDDVVEIRMAVYAERSPDQPLSCEALEFSEIDPETLAQSLVTEVSGRPGGRVELGDIPREPFKLFFAEALTASGTSVLAGCSSHGPITSDVVIDIEPADRLVILPVASASASGDQVVVENLVVTDLSGNPLRDSEIHWTLTGPGGFVAEGTTSTGEPAQSSLTIGDGPASPGPIRFEARASWAEPAQLGAVKAPPTIELALPATPTLTDGQGLAGTLAVGRLGAGFGLLALLDSAGARVGRLHCFDQTGSLASAASDEPLAGVVGLGLLRDPAAGDRVIAVSGTEWTEIDCSGPATTAPSPFAGRPSKLVAFPGCGDPDPALYGQLGPGQVAAADPDGGVLEDFSAAPAPEGIPDDVALRASGCVEDSLGGVRPTIVLGQARDVADPTFRTLVAARVDGELQVGPVGDLTTAVAAEPVSTGPGGLQLGEITEEGPSIGRYDLQPLPNNILTTSLIGEDPTASGVTEIATGDVDGDGLTDIVALLAFANTVQVFISLALPDTGDRLRGFFAGPITDRRAELAVADLDQDGDDDIVLFGSAGDEVKLTVLEMGP